MSKFVIGDLVVVNSKPERFEDQNGLIAIVTETNRGGTLPLKVEYTEHNSNHPTGYVAGDTNAYCDEDLSVYDDCVMTQPEFSLDEIAIAEDIMEELS